MSKLGRMRKDTLYDVRKEEYRARERERDSNSNSFDTDGTKHLMLSKFDSNCPACGEEIRIGGWIWWDHETRLVVHKACHQKNEQ